MATLHRSLCRIPLLLFLLAGCGIPERGDTRIHGHGGMGDSGSAPSNSEASLLGALALGLDGIELDVQLTADSVLVAYHAQHLEELTECTGLVNAHTWAQLRACTVTDVDAGQHPIVRLDSLLLFAARKFPGTEFTLDCKLFAAGDWWPYLHTYARALVALGRLHPIPGKAGGALNARLVVECQVDDFLLLLQARQPYLHLFRYCSDAEAGIWRATASHFNGITIHEGNITAEQVALAQGLGLEVAVYGVKGRFAHWRALRKKVDRLQSDSPNLFAR